MEMNNGEFGNRAKAQIRAALAWRQRKIQRRPVYSLKIGVW